MSDVYFIGLDDETTCGGKVLDGDPRINLYGVLHACEGDRVTCGVTGKTYEIVGGISFMQSHGRLMAGTLDSRSGCPCKSELIPSVKTASYTHKPSPARPMHRAVAPSATSPTRQVPPSSSYMPSSSLASGLAMGLGGAEPGFYIVPQSTTREAVEATLFPTRDPAVLRKFQALNPDRGDVKAGSMMVLSDPQNSTCSYQEAQLMQAAQEVKAALDPLTPEEANFMSRHRTEIASYIGYTSTGLGVGAVVMEKHLTGLRDTLQAMERLHQDNYRQHGHLRSPSFFADRKRLLGQLDAHLLNSITLRGQTTLGDHPKLKTALGISSRSLVHHWDKAGGPGQIPGFATHISATSRAVQYMKTGGVIGIVVGGISSALVVQEVCVGDSQTACRKVMVTEGAKFLGSAGLGYLAGEAAYVASPTICAVLGVTTAIGGVVCVAAVVGVGAFAGTKVGGVGGEWVGEVLYESTLP